MLSDFRPCSPRGVKKQISEHIRELILTSKLAQGEKLPSTQELARRWTTHVATVHAAMTPLVKEGLLERSPGAGTFVNKQKHCLTCLGLYTTYNYSGINGTLFENMLTSRIVETCSGKGIKCLHFADTRMLVEDSLAEMMDKADRREIQGVISVTSGWPIHLWMQKLSVPFSTMASSINIPNRVDLNAEDLLEKSFSALSEQGCRSVGIIVPCKKYLDAADGSVERMHPIHDHFFKCLVKYGMTSSPEWIRFPAGRVKKNENFSYEKFGYDQGNELLRCRKHPDGLILFTDVMAKGAITSFLKNKIDPLKIKLAISTNDDIGILCPFPATFIELPIKEVAEALLKILEDQVFGNEPKPIKIYYKRRRHNGC